MSTAGERLRQPVATLVLQSCLFFFVVSERSVALIDPMSPYSPLRCHCLPLMVIESKYQDMCTQANFFLLRYIYYVFIMWHEPHLTLHLLIKLKPTHLKSIIYTKWNRLFFYNNFKVTFFLQFAKLYPTRKQENSLSQNSTLIRQSYVTLIHQLLWQAFFPSAPTTWIEVCY